MTLHDVHKFAVAGHDGFASHPFVAVLCALGTLALAMLWAYEVGRWNTERRIEILRAQRAALRASTSPRSNPDEQWLASLHPITRRSVIRSEPS
jgi:hypothetical protein